ncbi:MAG: hypothetical protein KGJ90_07265 [Patescibacteria group bacterium]|nr:hypothetical protein [Patescibacteria group bacterium]
MADENKELDELRAAFVQLQEQFEELREARTAPERREARDDLEDAEAQFRRAARRLGLDPKQLRELHDEAARKQRRDEIRAVFAELAAEVADDDEEEAGDETKDGDGDEKDGDDGDGRKAKTGDETEEEWV